MPYAPRSIVRIYHAPRVSSGRCDRVTCPTTTWPIRRHPVVGYHYDFHLLPRASDQLGAPRPIPSFYTPKRCPLPSVCQSSIIDLVDLDSALQVLGRSPVPIIIAIQNPSANFAELTFLAPTSFRSILTIYIHLIVENVLISNHRNHNLFSSPLQFIYYFYSWCKSTNFIQAPTSLTVLPVPVPHSAPNQSSITRTRTTYMSPPHW